MDKNTKQRLYRLSNNNANTKRYEKTPNGFLVRLYRNMKSRINGVQWAKFHLYAGKELLDKEEFYTWAKNSSKFWELFKEYEDSNYDRKLAPSVDRVNSKLGYNINNMEWVTHSENSRRANYNKPRVQAKCIIHEGINE
jgi:hypothetical protein